MKHVCGVLAGMLALTVLFGLSVASIPVTLIPNTPQHRQSALAASRSSSTTDTRRPPGGPGPMVEADAYVQELCNSVRHEAQYMVQAQHGEAGQGSLGGVFDEFTAVLVRTQVVAGTNYFVKVKIADKVYAHLRIYKPLPIMKQPAVLISIKSGLDETEPLEFF